MVEGVEDALAGRPSVTLVVGEVGVGKTHLLKILEETVSDRVVVARGRTWDAGEAPAFWPLIQVIRSLLDHLPQDEVAAHLPPTAGAVARLVPELQALRPDLSRGVSGAGGRVALFQGVADLLMATSRRRPLLVTLEDLHAADEDTLLLVSFLLDHLDRGRVAVVGTVEIPHQIASLAELASRARRLDLHPLTEAGVAEMYALESRAPADDAIVSALHEASEGNPLFVREAIRLLDREGSLRRPDQSLGFRVPQGARAVLRRRLTKLAPETLDVVAVAGVTGRVFDAATIADATTLPIAQVLERLAPAVDAGVVREVSALGGFTFTHVLFREVIYEDLSMSERMRLHRAVLDALEQRYRDDLDDHLDELAHHSFKAAQATDPAKTIDYTLRAAERAAATAAYDKAARLYRRALKVGDLGGMARARKREVEAALARTQSRGDDAVAPSEGAPVVESAFTSLGDYWRIAYEGGELQLKDSKGLRYLAMLLRNPGEPLHALELVSLERGLSGGAAAPSRTDREQPLGSMDASGDLGETLDWRAKADYRRRLVDLQEEIAEATAFNDPERAARVELEMDALIRQLEQSLGFGGRQRKPEAERARTSVTKAIKGALARIEEHHSVLARHLQVTVRTGTLCSYQPDPRAAPKWNLS